MACIGGITHLLTFYSSLLISWDIQVEVQINQTPLKDTLLAKVKRIFSRKWDYMFAFCCPFPFVKKKIRGTSKLQEATGVKS